MNATYFPHRRSAASLSPAARASTPSGAEERADPTWARAALVALLAFTAAAYMWDLSASGYANSFYAAAVQAGTRSWKAMFFGSLDASSFITVDKPPASLWVMTLCGRIFGFSSWSMLVPQALEGVAAVSLLHAAVRRWFGAGAGLLAGALLAITPVATLMFRFNNPDALLVCLLVAGAYCLTRALEGASTRWMIAAGTMIGFAFLAKMMQAFLVLPAFGLVYLLGAPTGLRRRLAQMLAGAAAIVISGGWWVAIVALWPVGSRPFIDGSPDNNIFNLIVGYNGLGRIFGASASAGGGGGPGGGGGAHFSGATGVLRLFDSEMGAQASWLLPAAVLSLIVGLWWRRRAPRTDRTRAALLLWGGWLLVSCVVFSFASGVIHTYYTVALAPAIAAPIAIAGSLLWRERHKALTRGVATLVVLVTASWSWALLDRTPQWESWIRLLIPASAVVAVVGLLAPLALRRLGRRASIAAAVFAAVACLSAPIAYSAQTIATVHTGAIPSAGPGSSIGGGPGGAPGRSGGSTFDGVGAPGSPAAAGAGSPPRPPAAGTPPAGATLFGSPGGPGNAAASAGSARRLLGRAPELALGGGAGGGAQLEVGVALKKALRSGAGRFRWVAAVSGSQGAASLELATGGDAVMAIGGFNDQGGRLTLAEFEQYVKNGDIHYYLGSGSAGSPAAGGAGGSGASGVPGSSSGDSITRWVRAHFMSVTIGDQTIYDLIHARA